MPRLEVLGREAVEDKNNMVAQRQKQQEMMDNAEYKRGMLKYYADNLKLQSKQTDNEVEKLKLTQKAAKFDYMSKVMGEAVKSADPQKALMTALQMFPEDFHDILGDPDFNKTASQLQPSGENQRDTAVANLIQGKLNGVRTPIPAQSGAVNPNASAVNAVSGSPLIPKITAGGVDIVFPEDAAAVKANETRAGNIEDMRKEAAPALGMIDMLEQKYDAAFPEHPKKGLPIKEGIAKSIGAWAQTDTEAASYLATREAFLSKIVRALGEKGVLTNQDIARVKKALATQFTSSDLAHANFQTIRDIIAAGVEEYTKYGPAVGDVRPGKPGGKTLTTGKQKTNRKYQVTVEGD